MVRLLEINEHCCSLLRHQNIVPPPPHFCKQTRFCGTCVQLLCSGVVFIWIRNSTSIVRLQNLQLQSTKPELYIVGKSVFKYVGENNFLKTRYPIRCVVNFNNAGVVTHESRVGSRSGAPCGVRLNKDFTNYKDMPWRRGLSVSSPPATEEAGATYGSWDQSWQGIGWR
jgi:hypothetical protein